MNENARRRLLHEARSAAVLDHPSIVTIHSIDDHEGLTFFVMEFVEGQTLKSAIGRGGLTGSQVPKIGAQVAQALAVAHAVNIIHRDIKSENIPSPLPVSRRCSTSGWPTPGSSDRRPCER